MRRPHGIIELPGVGGALHAVLEPLLLLRVLDVHVLDADGAAVGGAEAIEYFTQRFEGLHVRGDGAARGFDVAGEEGAIEIPDGQRP